MSDEALYLHTLSTEAYEAAVAAASESLQSSDLYSVERLRILAQFDAGDVVSEAARALLKDS